MTDQATPALDLYPHLDEADKEPNKDPLVVKAMAQAVAAKLLAHSVVAKS